MLPENIKVKLDRHRATIVHLDGQCQILDLVLARNVKKVTTAQGRPAHGATNVDQVHMQTKKDLIRAKSAPPASTAVTRILI